jgi:hypothetical protein
MDFSSINFIAVAAGTIIAFALGLIWCAPPVFGRTWQKHTGITDAQMKDGRGHLRIGPAVVLTFVMGLMLDVIMPAETLNWDDGAVMGLLTGLGLVAPAIAIHYIFSKRSVHLYLIDAGYSVFSLLIMGACIAAMS